MAFLKKKQKLDTTEENNTSLENSAHHDEQDNQDPKEQKKDFKEQALSGAAHGAKHLFSPMPFDILKHGKDTGMAAGRLVKNGANGVIVRPIDGIFIKPTKRIYQSLRGEGLDEIPGNYTTRPPFDDYYDGLITKAQLKKDGLHYIQRYRLWIKGVIFTPQIAFVSWLVSDGMGFPEFSYFLLAFLLFLARTTQFWTAYMSIYGNYNGSPIEYIRHFIKKKSYKEMIPDEKRLNEVLNLYAREKKALKALEESN